MTLFVDLMFRDYIAVFILMHAQIFLLVPVVTAVCDLIYTIAKGRKDSAQFQYVSPIVIIVSMVSYGSNLDQTMHAPHLIVL